MRTLVLVGHPRRESLTAALAAEYAAGARAAGAEVVELHLSELAFDPHVRASSPAEQTLEPELERARELIEWAEHLVFAFPNWWGTMPALLKGFLDRTLLPGFAFREEDGHYYGLLHGRTAELLITMDVPPPIYRWVQGAPGSRAMRRATLGLCGIETVRTTAFSRPSHSDAREREHWFARARYLGRRLEAGPRSGFQRVRHEVGTWFAALRPQFFPMSLLAYTVGALLAGAPLSPVLFLLGMACMASLKVATVLTNDLYDQESDARNRRWSPFTGGGRGLQEGGLSRRSYRRAATGALVIFTGTATLLLSMAPTLPVLAVLVPLAIVALGYTVPPLKLSHRGLGELDVALTHGPGVVLLGHVVQGGPLSDPLPWLLGLLIALAVSPAIILSGIPDREADAAAGKRTLAVFLGTANAARLALALVVMSALVTTVTVAAGPALPAGLPWIAVPHAIVLSLLLRRYLRAGAPEQRIDALMVGSLLYIGWFVLLPVVGLA